MRHYDWLAHHARMRPNAPCWTDLHSDRSFTWREAEDRCARLASHLSRNCGVKRGDRIAVLAMNSTDVMEIHSACAKIGAIFLPINWRLAPPEVDFILSDSEPQALIHDGATADLVGQLSVRAPHVIATTGGGQPSPYEEAIAAAGPDVPLEIMDHEDIWTIMYTSGTTGRPKGAPNTYGMAFWNAVNLGVPTGAAPDSVGLTMLPLFHTGGLNTFTTVLLHAGGHSLIMRAFDPGQALGYISDPARKVSHFLVVPAMYLFMSQHPDFETADFSRIRTAAVGGAPTPVPLLETYKAKGVAITQGFGMTETSPCVSIQTPETAFGKPGSAGRPALHCELKVMKEDGTEAAPGEIGELWCKGANITPGYWRRPEANAKEFTDGWFHTGDAAKIDAEGDLWIVDRWKDMYISGGENVYPAEVENVLYAIPGVAEAAVVGMPDDRWGEVGCAFIARKPGAAVSAGDVIDWCQGKLARFKIPARVEFVAALPRNATGKVLKRELRQQI